jgi:multisubunit Na+/H+ antiporter MnhC subunit
MTRRILAGSLAVLALLAVPLGDLGLWTKRQLLNTDSFTAMANDVVQQPEVHDALANRITLEIVRQVPRLASQQSVLRSAVGTVVGTPAFQSVFETAVGGLHDQLTNGDDQLTLGLDAFLPLVRAEVAKTSPQAAARVPQSGLPAVTVVEKKDMSALWVGVDVARKVSWLLPLIALALLIAAVALASKRATMLVIVGAGLAAAAVAIVLLLRAGRSVLFDVVGAGVSRQTFNSAWDAITSSLVTQTIILGVLGLLAVGAGVLWQRRDRGNLRPDAWA